MCVTSQSPAVILSSFSGMSCLTQRLLHDINSHHAAQHQQMQHDSISMRCHANCCRSAMALKPPMRRAPAPPSQPIPQQAAPGLAIAAEPALHGNAASSGSSVSGNASAGNAISRHSLAAGENVAANTDQLTGGGKQVMGPPPAKTR